MKTIHPSLLNNVQVTKIFYIVYHYIELLKHRNKTPSFHDNSEQYQIPDTSDMKL